MWIMAGYFIVGAFIIVVTAVILFDKDDNFPDGYS